MTYIPTLIDGGEKTENTPHCFIQLPLAASGAWFRNVQYKKMYSTLYVQLQNEVQYKVHYEVYITRYYNTIHYNILYYNFSQIQYISLQDTIAMI